MATYYNPKIITNNIEFSVDAANVKSWSGASSLGTNYGYWGGGNTPSPGSSTTMIDRLDYDNDTATMVAKGPLNQGRKYHTAVGNVNYGYYCGGFPGAISTVDRTDYANDTATAANKGPLSSARYYLAATGNASYGYIGGGGPGTLSTVDRIDYSSDTGTAPAKGPLNTVRRKLTATGNTSYGYFGGGHSGAASLSTVDRVDYSNDTPTASPKGPLSGTRYSNAATGNASYGYFGGGYGGSPNALRTIVDRIDYSSDTGTAPAKGPLVGEMAVFGATGTTSYGYFGGSSGPITTIERIDFSNDTPTAVAKSQLSATRQQTAAVGPRAYGLPSSESFWKDMTGKGHDGTVDGATYQGGNSGVWNFDGSGSSVTSGPHIITSHSNNFDFGSVDFAIEAWCRPTNASVIDPSIVALWNFPDDKRSWGIFGNTGGSAATFDGSVRGTASPDGEFASRTEITGTLALNAWNHVVFTRISNTLNFFINGVSQGTASYSTAVYSNTTDGVMIGAMGDAAESRNHFNGKIAQVRIYKAKGLTASEVLNNFNATRTRFGV